MDDTSPSIDHLLTQIQEKTRPPVHQWRPIACREIDIQIKRNGDWYYQGSLIQRPRMVRLFSTVLRRENEAYFLVTPVEKLRIQVDDAPFTVVSMEVLAGSGQQHLVFTDNVGDKIIAGKNNPIFVNYHGKKAEPSPYIEIRDNLNALIMRSVYYHMAEYCVALDGYYGVWSDRCFFKLAPVEG